MFLRASFSPSSLDISRDTYAAKFSQAHYPAAAHAPSGLSNRVRLSVCLSVCLSVNKKLKCVLNARYTALAASKEHVDKENRTYFTSIMPQDDQYGSIIPCRSNLSIYTVYTGNR